MNAGHPGAATCCRLVSVGRINRAVDRVDPAFALLVADGGHDQQIARAGRGDVRKAHAFGLVACELFGLVLNQIERRTAGNANGAGAALGIDVPAGGCAANLRGHVRENDDGEFEPLRLVHGHQAHAVAALFENRRLAGLAVFGLLAQLVDEPAERNPSVRFVAARELGHVKHIRQHLLAAMLERKPDVRARGLEQR